MKITDLKVFPVGQFVYVKILTDEGVHGVGEASLSGRPLAVVGALEHIKPLLIGQDATRIEHIWQDIFRGTFWRGGPVLQSALAGIDIALWDLAGKALGVPTYRLARWSDEGQGSGLPAHRRRGCRAASRTGAPAVG